MNPYLVIGSGPAGVSCAQALLEQGEAVLMVDGGQTLEPERQAQLEAIATEPPSAWSPQSTAFLKDGLAVGASGIPLKRAYGSDYPYRLSPGATPVHLTAANVKASYAPGGLSAVWGSAIMPYRKEDIHDWPVTLADLEEGYRRVLDFMPLAAQHDDLAEVFPLYSSRTMPLPLSRQAQRLLRRLESRRSSLRQRGVYFGASRLAVNARDCVLCGNCMYGCPTQLIYSSDSTLRDLHRSGRFEYRPGLTVREITEEYGAVTVQAIDNSGTAVRLHAPRVFLAAGVLETASILLRSRKEYGRPVTLHDSQYFLLPVLRRESVGRVGNEDLHTLAQLFIEIFDESVSPYTIHLQTYTYNELFREAMLQSLGPMKTIFPTEQFLSRLLLFQGYLHSQHSSEIELTLSKQGSSDHLQLEGRKRPETQRKLQRLVKKLIGLYPLTDLFPLFPLLQRGAAGRGFHCGGSFPMRSNPDVGESDIYGRPHGYRRTHVVDASIFPSVPATTITFTAMANAYRIGAALPVYEEVLAGATA